MIDAAPDERLRLILLLLWQTGGRITEVLTLKPLGILPPDRLRLLNEKQHKAPRGSHTPAGKALREWKVIYVPETLVVDLQAYVKTHAIGPTQYIFEGRAKGRPVNRSTIYRELIQMSAGLGLTRERNTATRGTYSTGLHAHLWRHGYAVNSMDQGVSIGVVQRQLGHASLSATSVYAKVSDGARRDAVRAVRF